MIIKIVRDIKKTLKSNRYVKGEKKKQTPDIDRNRIEDARFEDVADDSKKNNT